MKGHVAVSFENGLVKVVRGSLNRGSLGIHETRVLDEGQFDDYLRSVADREFLVVNDFQNPFQDILLLPPADEKYLKNLAELELKKKFPELKDALFFIRVLREIQREGKRNKETFVFAVQNGEVNGLIERFGIWGKRVTALYPNILTLAPFVRVPDEMSDQAILVVADLGTTKTIFLVLDGKACFVRVAQSDGRGINDLDVENINMTVAYARQSLRMSPAAVLFLHVPTATDAPSMRPIVPLLPTRYPANILADEETINRFATPISALLYHEKFSGESLLPHEYRTIGVERAFYLYGAGFCLLLACLLGVSMVPTVAEVLLLSEKVATLKTEIREKEPVLLEYEGASRELQKFLPALAFMNQINTSPDVSRFLSLLSPLNVHKTRIHSIDIKNDKDGIQAKVDGLIAAGSFAELQDTYRVFIDRINRIHGVQGMSHKLELKEKTFTVDLKWKG